MFLELAINLHNLHTPHLCTCSICSMCAGYGRNFKIEYAKLKNMSKWVHQAVLSSVTLTPFAPFPLKRVSQIDSLCLLQLKPPSEMRVLFPTVKTGCRLQSPSLRSGEGFREGIDKFENRSSIPFIVFSLFRSSRRQACRVSPCDREKHMGIKKATHRPPNHRSVCGYCFSPSAFTTFLNSPFVSPATINSAASTATATWASALLAARCGVCTTPASPTSGWSAAGGSSA